MHIVGKIIDSETEQSAGESVLIGVIYKEMSLKPSVISNSYWTSCLIPCDSCKGSGRIQGRERFVGPR